MICGPNGPFSNLPPAIETHVEFISDLIAIAETDPARLVRTVNVANETTSINGGGHRNGHASGRTPSHGIIEAEAEAEEQWTGLCDQLSSKSLFRRIETSWIFGANVPGKKAVPMFFFGGLGPYKKKVQGIYDDDLRGFKRFDAQPGRACL